MSDSKNSNHRILVIDDNPAIHADFRKVLKKKHNNLEFAEIDRELFGEDLETTPASQIDFQIDSAYQGQEGLDLVTTAMDQSQPYALAFVDMRMPPGWDGLTTIEAIWAIAPDTQIVICTAFSDSSWQEMADRLGHTDRLLVLKKPFDSIEVLQLAISLTEKWNLGKQAMLKRRELERLVHARTKELQYAAFHDSLTGLPNRAKFHEKLEESLVAAERYDHSIAVALLDVDFFKSINDTLGHPVGDAVICRVASFLKECIRDCDTVARLGGDEFAIILTHVNSPQEVATLASRIRSLIGEPFQVDEETIAIDVSLGISFAPNDCNDPVQLLKNADLALYRAKEEGRGCYRFFEPEMNTRMVRRRELDLRIRTAIKACEFELFYQPQFETGTNSICGVEALVRWNDPERGIVLPGSFIPLAEETGLIVKLGEWIINQACADAAKWPDNIRIAVNVSAIQFSSDRFLDTVVRALDSSGIVPNRLEIEITETALLRDVTETIEVLHKIRALGVRIVMDDFGTGYSSLSYLRSFPFDKLKIDKSFVKDLSSAEDAQAIVRAVANIGQCMGMETIAEGVETQSQLEQVSEEGYTQFQGFLHGRPMPVSEINRVFFGPRPAPIDIRLSSGPILISKQD